MNSYQKLGKNTLLVFLGTLSSKLLGVLMLPFYTAWLSLEQYGTIDLVATYASFFSGFLTLSMAEAVFRFPKDEPEEKQKAYFTTGLVAVLSSLSLFGILIFTLVGLFHCDFGFLSDFSGFIIAYILFVFLQQYMQHFSRSLDRMDVFVVSGIVLSVVMLVLGILLVPFYGAYGYLYSQIIGAFCAASYAFLRLRMYKYFSFEKFSLSIAKEMLAYSLPMIPNAIIWWVLNVSNRIFLEYFQTMDDIAVFAVSNKFPAMITVVLNSFFLSWQISVLDDFKKKDFNLFYNRMIHVLFVVVVFILVVLTVFSYQITDLFVDHKFIAAWKYMPFLSLAAVFSALSMMVGTTFMAVKKTKPISVSSLWGGFVCVVLNLLLIPRLNLEGAVLSLLLANFVILAIRVIQSDRIVCLEDKLAYIIQFFVMLGLMVVNVSVESLLLKYVLILFFISVLLLLNRKYLKSAYLLVVDRIVHLKKKRNEK